MIYTSGSTAATYFLTQRLQFIHFIAYTAFVNVASALV